MYELKVQVGYCSRLKRFLVQKHQKGMSLYISMYLFFLSSWRFSICYLFSFFFLEKSLVLRCWFIMQWKWWYPAICYKPRLAHFDPISVSKQHLINKILRKPVQTFSLSTGISSKLPFEKHFEANPIYVHLRITKNFVTLKWEFFIWKS